MLLLATVLAGGCASQPRTQAADSTRPARGGADAPESVGTEGRPEASGTVAGPRPPSAADGAPDAGRPAASAAVAARPGGAPARRGPGVRLREPLPVGGPSAQGAEGGASRGGGRAELFPANGLLYDPYLAAPRQSRMAVKIQIPVGGSDRNRKIENTLGLHRPIVRWSSADDPTAGTEVQFEAAVFARFDMEEHWDMDASDWRFGIPVVRREGDLAWKIHLYHLTSHLGDEHIERTGRDAIAYHLEEAAFGLSWDASDSSRLYGEAGVAVYTSKETDNGRFQLGYEWVGNRAESGFSPYFAVDLQARNDQDWTPGKTAAAGIAYGSHIRFGLEYYHGRDTQTQFMQDQARYVSLGLAIDF